MEQATEAINIHYEGWQSGNQNADLICVPATLDLQKKYIGQIPPGQIVNFSVEEYNEVVRQVDDGEVDRETAAYGGFEVKKLVRGFNPNKYKKALPEVRQYQAEQLSLDGLRNAARKKKMGGFLLIDVSSQDIVKKIFGKQSRIHAYLCTTKPRTFLHSWYYYM